MKFLILFLIVLISPIELRRHDDDIYQLDDSLNDKYDRARHRPNPPFRLDETDADDDQEYSPPFQHEKKHPSRKKVLDDNDYVNDESDDDDNDKTTKSTSTSKSTDQNELSDTSMCINKYDIRPEQLVKVKELTNGAHMIRFVLIDKRTLISDMKVKDSCMLDCCAERSCDLAMLSEKPTHEGFKCYLFACNGSCVLASHQDYTIMMPKKDSAMVKTDATSTSTVANNDLPHKGSFFRETSVIVFLIFGIVCTMILFVLLYCHCRDSQKRSRRVKNYHVDEDYLINGLYL